MIEAYDVHKTYAAGAKKLHVLKGINLEIAQAGFVSILGPSGAGKSTLLHILGGLDKPNKGRVSFDGINLAAASDEKRALIRRDRIGFVFQFYHLLSGFSAIENVLLPACIAGKAGAGRQKAKALLIDMGLGARLDHKPRELSGGEQQRVAIARALVNEPDVLLCDEPTGNLDSQMGESIIRLLQRLNRDKQLTLVIVTHDAEIAGKADRVFHIKDGRLV